MKKSSLRILMVNKYWFLKGGSERYTFQLSQLLEKHGHHIIPFAMRDEHNYPSSYSQYFVDHVDYHIASKLEKMSKAPFIWGKMIYSLHAQKKLRALLKEIKPDIAHLHMIDHQISPSILPVLKNAGIPIVQTVHQYKLICPNYRLYVPQKNKICELCLSGNYWHAVLQKCHKNSRIASAMVAIESAIHRKLKIYQKNIDVFIAPSQFMASKLIQGGIPESKIKVIYHFINIDDFPMSKEYSDYFVYYGRLSKEKGLFTLIKAVRNIRGAKLKIIGEGPLRGQLEKYISAHHIQNVQFLGKKLGKELYKWVSQSMFVVLPSEWYENSPMVIYESNAMGKPVIGAELGGIKELIQAGKDGELFESGNAKDLEKKIKKLLDNPNMVKKMGKEARKKAVKLWDSKIHYQKILDIYQMLLKS